MQMLMFSSQETGKVERKLGGEVRASDEAVMQHLHLIWGQEIEFMS